MSTLLQLMSKMQLSERLFFHFRFRPSFRPFSGSFPLFPGPALLFQGPLLYLWFRSTFLGSVLLSLGRASFTDYVPLSLGRAVPPAAGSHRQRLARAGEPFRSSSPQQGVSVAPLGVSEAPLGVSVAPSIRFHRRECAHIQTMIPCQANRQHFLPRKCARPVKTQQTGSTFAPKTRPVCQKIADRQHFCPENAPGLSKISRPAALLP